MVIHLTLSALWAFRVGADSRHKSVGPGIRPIRVIHQPPCIWRPTRPIVLIVGPCTLCVLGPYKVMTWVNITLDGQLMSIRRRAGIAWISPSCHWPMRVIHLRPIQTCDMGRYLIRPTQHMSIGRRAVISTFCCGPIHFMRVRPMQNREMGRCCIRPTRQILVGLRAVIARVSCLLGMGRGTFIYKPLTEHHYYPGGYTVG